MSLLTTRDRRSRLHRNTRRVSQIASVAVRYGFAEQLRHIPGKRVHQWLRGSSNRDIAELSTAVRIRLALAELGTTFIKFGQMLSTRPDLVGQDIARELTRLQSDTPPDPPGTAEAAIQKELGSDPATVFASFDPKPFASASIAQVHYARLHSGENVVVKIQKDGIAAQIEADLSILSDLAELAEKEIAELRLYHPVAVVRQFATMIRGELDFQRELRNIQQFQSNFAGDPTVHFPVPFPELSTRRVLTMERLEGALVSQIKLLPGPNPQMDEFARRGANMYLEMIFRDAFYHADPHPGNLMLLPDEVVGVLDCGMVQPLDDELRETVEDLLMAAVNGDARAMTDAVSDLSTSPPPGGRQALESDITELVAEYGAEVVSAIGGMDVGPHAEQSDGSHPPQPSVPAAWRVAAAPYAGGTRRHRQTAESRRSGCSSSFSRTPKRPPDAGSRPSASGFRCAAEPHDWKRLSRTLPGDVNDILQRMRAGTLSVHLEHRRLDPVINRLVMGLLTSSLLLGSSLLWSMRAEPLIKGVSLFGAVGYALAFIMGLRLFRAMRCSERPPGNK